ncbi:hypothetical protein [Bdellovibrio sp. GT3]|uniref:hypothetical protein n=1 Tax=Bdellovibrio sp. GT3 TaxID=3136282 RepID=UPI0030F12706
MNIFLVLLMNLMGWPAFAETLVDFSDGTQLKSEDLLAQGKTLIYIEKDCAPCRIYVFDINRCEDDIKKNIQLVSLSTPAQTKTMARTLPKRLPLFILKDPSAAKAYTSTPTTKIKDIQKVGRLTCEELKKLL